MGVATFKFLDMQNFMFIICFSRKYPYIYTVYFTTVAIKHNMKQKIN